MSTVETMPAIHTHKSNFGRFVAGCPKCAEKYPNGPLDRKLVRRHVPTAAEKRAAIEAEVRAQVLAEMAVAAPVEAPAIPAEEVTVAATAAAVGISPEQLVEAMRVLGTELRRPDPEVEAKRAADKLRDEINKQNERKVIAERAALIAAEQAACNHKMQNGISRIRGQVHNDGLLHELCTWCQKIFEPRVVSQQERAARGL